MREGATNTCGDNVDGRVGVACTDESVRASNEVSAHADDACAIPASVGTAAFWLGDPLLFREIGEFTK